MAITFDETTGIYSVNGIYVNQKKAKRDGRQPSTGAFLSGSHTGAVSLKGNVLMSPGELDFNIKDKTHYVPIVAHGDSNNTSFDATVTSILTANTDNPSASTLVLEDFRNNVVNIDFNRIDNAACVFVANSIEMFFDMFGRHPNLIVDGGQSFVVNNFTMNSSGNVYANSVNEADSNDLRSFALGQIFPAV